jgi:hypothetical protein
LPARAHLATGIGNFHVMIFGSITQLRNHGGNYDHFARRP